MADDYEYLPPLPAAKAAPKDDYEYLPPEEESGVGRFLKAQLGRITGAKASDFRQADQEAGRTAFNTGLGAQKGITGSLADEIHGGVGFAKQLATGPRDAGSLVRAYDAGKGEIQGAERQAKAENPKLFDMGQAVGIAAQPQAAARTVAGKIVSGMASGAVNGFGASEAKNSAGVAADTLAGGTIGGSVSGALGAAQAAIPVAQRTASKFGNWLREKGGEFFTGAIKPGNKALDAIESAGMTPGQFGAKNIELGNNPGSLSVLNPFRSPAENIAKRTQANGPKLWGGIRAAEAAGDRAVPGVAAANVSSAGLDKAAGDFGEEAQSGIREAMFKQLLKEQQAAGGPAAQQSVSRLGDLKRSYNGGWDPSVPDSVPVPVAKAMRSTYKTAQEGALASEPRLLNDLQTANKNYMVNDVAGAAAKKTARADASRGVIADIGSPKEMLGRAARHAAPAVANGLYGIGSKVMQVPKYAEILTDAAQRGNAAVAATHAYLMQNDPEYANLNQEGN